MYNERLKAIASQLVSSKLGPEPKEDEPIDEALFLEDEVALEEQELQALAPAPTAKPSLYEHLMQRKAAQERKRSLSEFVRKKA